MTDEHEPARLVRRGDGDHEPGRFLMNTTGEGVSQDYAANGQRFLIIIKEGGLTDVTSRQIILVENWTEELKRLVPTN